jgi:branched-chain amino acid transport system substrate-binding protein
MPLSVGQIINNRYRIVKLLGQGGFGAVYQAWDTTFEAPCAVKENNETSDAAQRQFSREARLLHNLRHPNLPQVKDYFIISGQGQYLVMDFVEGEDLDEMLVKAGESLPVPQSLDWIGQVCDALMYLHSQNPPVIHRDIKPSNIKVTSQGKAMLVDFGIAKTFDPSLRTTMGARAVTPGYSPPEQYGTGTTDAQSDIYALGATLYTLLTGKRPSDSVDVMTHCAPSPPPVHALNPTISLDLSKALEKAMALDRAQRWQNVAAFKQALLQSSMPESVAAGWKRGTSLDGKVLVQPNRRHTQTVPMEITSPVSSKKTAPWIGLAGFGIFVLVGAIAIGLAIWSLTSGGLTSVLGPPIATRTNISTNQVVIETAISNTQAPLGRGIIKVASQSPLSGGQSAIGVDIKNGAELAMEQLKKPLEDMGFKVELAAFDDQANPSIGVANAKNIVSDPAILCVVGHYNSGVQIPSSEVYHISNLANVSPANTNPKVTDRGYLEVSRIVGRDDVQGVVAAQFAISKGARSAYVIHDKTAYGQGIAEFFKGEFEKSGQVVGFEGTEEKVNFDSILASLITANSDVVLFGGIYDQSATLFKQAREKGFLGMLLSDDGFDSPEAINFGGPVLLNGGGLFYTTVTGSVKLYPGTAKFQTDFKAQYGSDPKPFAAHGYDSMAICLKAIEDAAKAAGNKMPTRLAVAKAVRAIKDFPGITGTINFNAKGDLVIAKYFVIQVISADPAKWNDNKIDQSLDIAPP